ncbi:unnamed protein product [Orchesella dallaii]|uniref:G-protein coupled receptors family 1 profile domain-containing protein n=1 Tax=Orchesella dallaii TaxID=48710 RepID=A0ABP1RQE7_9HEXA
MSHVQSPERLDYWSCFFLDSANHVFISNNETRFKYYCKVHGSYLSESEDGKHTLFKILTSVICSVCFFGVLTNILNILLLRNSISRGLSFRESLIILAAIELFLCFFTGVKTILAFLILCDWNRSQGAFYLFYISNHLFHLSQTVSVYHSILVAIERYFMVVAPLKSKAWLYRSKRRSAVVFLLVLTLSVILNIPWFLKSYVAKNEGFGFKTNSTLGAFPYVIKRHKFAEMWLAGLQEVFLGLKSIAPFPIVLILNVLQFFAIHNANKRRVLLTNGHKKDIKSAKMFSVIILILLSCNIMPIASYASSRARTAIYREIILLQLLSIVTGAAINFIIYLAFWQAFRNEFWKLTGNIWKGSDGSECICFSRVKQ